MSKTVTELGRTYKHVLNGFQGVCTGKASYLTGCDQSCLRPSRLDKDGKPVEGEWFDDTLLKLVPSVKQIIIDTEPVAEKPTSRRAGGPNADTPSIR